ncbi:MAG: D-TA family PLP-dependent enzyme [Bacteroidota bacterium]
MPNSPTPWYALRTPDAVDSPALLIYPDRVDENIRQLVAIAGHADRLRPHVKTHKMAEVAKLHLKYGIHKFKCSTISEAEMLASSGAQDVLLAYQAVGPKLYRLLKLAGNYPHVTFGTLVDDEASLKRISHACQEAKKHLHVWLDLNNGMGRTGIDISERAINLYLMADQSPGIQVNGIHVYDGHFRQSEFANRKSKVDDAFAAVLEFKDQLISQGVQVPNIIVGGSPTFPVHAMRNDVDLSPGTYVFWDVGYGEICAELPFLPAAILLTRIISKPGGNRLCLDLGHKAVGAENPIQNRVRFLNAKVLAYLGQSEEHLVVEVADATAHQVGDIWYGIPYHVCPTVALYQEGNIVEAGEVTDRWMVVARDRRILV